MPEHLAKYSRRNSAATLGGFLAIVVAVGASIGLAMPRDDWFAMLNKPSDLPGIWFFAMGWIFSYIALAIVGWRLWLAQKHVLLTFWVLLLMLVWAILPSLFGLNNIILTISILGLALMLALYLFLQIYRRDVVAKWALIPHFAWLAGMSGLCVSLWDMN